MYLSRVFVASFSFKTRSYITAVFKYHYSSELASPGVVPVYMQTAFLGLHSCYAVLCSREENKAILMDL